MPIVKLICRRPTVARGVLGASAGRLSKLLTKVSRINSSSNPCAVSEGKKAILLSTQNSTIVKTHPVHCWHIANAPVMPVCVRLALRVVPTVGETPKSSTSARLYKISNTNRVVFAIRFVFSLRTYYSRLSNTRVIGIP